MRSYILAVAVVALAGRAEAQQPGKPLPSSSTRPGKAPSAAPAPPTTGQDADSEDVRRAKTLFNEGRDALAQGDTEIACSKFDESNRLARAAGTMFNLAQCEETHGRLLEAIRMWKDGVSLIPEGDDRVAPANTRISALEAKVPELSISIGPDVPKKAEVRVNTDLIERSALATPLRLNPGSYAVSLSAPKQETVVVKVQLGDSDKKTIDLAFPPTQRTSPRRVLGFAVGGVGLAALAVGGITGIVILARDGSIDDECPKGACTRKGYRDVEANRDWIAANWVSFGIGVVATGVGAYLLLTSPSDAQPAPPKTGFGIGGVAGGAGLSAWRRF